MSPDRYKKEDAERAQAIVDTLYRQVVRMDAGGVLREVLQKNIPFLMEVFRAVRGERD